MLTLPAQPSRTHLITQVATVPAPTADVTMTDVIQADLADRDLLPAEHLLDSGYVSAEHLVTSATKHQIELVGPVLLDTSWQAAAAEGFDSSCFTIDWEARTVTCPAGKVSRSWSEAKRDDYPFYQVKFSRSDCRACPVRDHCTRCTKGPRQLDLRPREEHEAVQAARQRQTTEEFAGRYRQRAGIEGTLAQGLKGCGLRQARYRTLPKVHLEHVATAVAISLQRLDAWWTETPPARTRVSRFTTLAA